MGSRPLDLFGLDTGSHLFHKAWTGSAWAPSVSEWEPLSGTFSSAPAAASWGPGRRDVFGLGTDSQVYHQAWTASGWAPLELLGGQFAIPFSGTAGPQDLLILAPDEFMAAVQPLVQHKNQSGMTAIAASISSLMPFFRGADDPEMIKRAIQYAHENLATKYVMLVGDASLFPVRFRHTHRLSQPYPDSAAWNAAHPALQNPPIITDAAGNYAGGGNFEAGDLYYANLYHHTAQYPETTILGAFDTWDANRNGLYNEANWVGVPQANPDNVDGYPDIAVGRVTAHTAADVTAYVSKVIAYESAEPGAAELTFVADQQYPGATDGVAAIISNSELTSRGVAAGRISYLLIENPKGNPCAAASWDPGRLDIFALGADGSQVYHKAWDGTGWLPSPTGWDPAGGSCDSFAAVTAWGRTGWTSSSVALLTIRCTTRRGTGPRGCRPRPAGNRWAGSSPARPRRSPRPGPGRHLRHRDRRPDVPQGLGRQRLAAVRNGLGSAGPGGGGRAVHQPGRGGLLGRGPGRHLRHGRR